MDRITVADAEKNFASLVNRVYSEGVAIELERGGEVIARIAPAAPRSRLTVRELGAFLNNLSRLGDDAEPFLNDLRTIRREMSAETDPWA